MAGNEVLLDGWLEKKGEKGLVKLYLRRWFEVKLCGGELRASYYASIEGNELGYIPLNKITEIKASEENDVDFTISVPGRIYYLRATDDNQKKSWMAGLDMKQAEALPKLSQEDRLQSHGTVLLNAFPDQRQNDGVQAFMDVVTSSKDNDATNSATDYYGKKEVPSDGGYGVLIDQVYYGTHGGSPIPKKKGPSTSPRPKKKGTSTSPKPKKKESSTSPKPQKK